LHLILNTPKPSTSLCFISMTFGVSINETWNSPSPNLLIGLITVDS
jgi:hypothetical protein